MGQGIKASKVLRGTSTATTLDDVFPKTPRHRLPAIDPAKLRDLSCAHQHEC